MPDAPKPGERKPRKTLAEMAAEANGAEASGCKRCGGLLTKAGCCAHCGHPREVRRA